MSSPRRPRATSPAGGPGRAATPVPVRRCGQHWCRGPGGRATRWLAAARLGPCLAHRRRPPARRPYPAGDGGAGRSAARAGLVGTPNRLAPRRVSAHLRRARARGSPARSSPARGRALGGIHCRQTAGDGRLVAARLAADLVPDRAPAHLAALRPLPGRRVCGVSRLRPVLGLRGRHAARYPECRLEAKPIGRCSRGAPGAGWGACIPTLPQP